MAITTLFDPCAQNVPKTKLECVKLVEITGDQKKLLAAKIST